jgi:CTP:molybdopterin cytidylyltransferase MocA
LHGYASGIYSSRRIAKAAVERADFMMIVAGDPPDFVAPRPCDRKARALRPSPSPSALCMYLPSFFALARGGQSHPLSRGRLASIYRRRRGQPILRTSPT